MKDAGRLAALVLFGCLSSPQAAGQEPASLQELPAHVFQRAEALTRLAGRSDGAAAWRWLGEAARLYAADYRDGATGAVAAEAALRHGKLLERLGRMGPARGAYLRAIEIAQQPDRRARARMAYAHALRREGSWKMAEQAYFDLVLDPSTPRAFLGASWEWRGRCQRELGDSTAALASYCAWTATAGSLAEEVRATDARASLLHELGRHGEAWLIMRALYRRLEPLLRPNSDMGADLFARLNRLAILERSRECVWRSVHLGHHEGDREIVRVAQRETHRPDPRLPCVFCRRTVEAQLRGGLPIADDFEVAEADSAGPAGSKDLHPGLLGGHPGGEVHRRFLTALALLLFGRGEHPVEHGLAPARQTGLQPGDVDQIHPDSGHSLRQPHDHRGGA